MGIFEVFPLLFMLAFLGIFGTIIATFVRGFKQERKNDRSPRLTVPVKVVTKREEMTRHTGGQHGTGHYHTRYYVTFEVESGDRMELPVEGFQYGMLVEGDKGKLTFQGTRFLNFERT